MNIEGSGIPPSSSSSSFSYFPSNAFFYNPLFYQFPAAQTFPFFTINSGNENGTPKICLACAEGTYCGVAASLLETSSAATLYAQNPPSFSIKTESLGEKCTGVESQAAAATSSNDENVIIKREIEKEIAAVADTLSAQIPEQQHAKVYVKHEPPPCCQHHHPSLQHQQQHGNKEVPKQRRPKMKREKKVIPNLDENGVRKRYSRFRSKTHICDFCNKSFTLKQNVQTHMSLYHMSSNPLQRPLAGARKTVKKQKRQNSTMPQQ